MLHSNSLCLCMRPRMHTLQVPSGLLPAMELDGQLVIESADIMDALERAFPESALLPLEGTPQRQRAAQLFRLERQLFGDWCRWLCGGGW